MTVTVRHLKDSIVLDESLKIPAQLSNFVTSVTLLSTKRKSARCQTMEDGLAPCQLSTPVYLWQQIYAWILYSWCITFVLKWGQFSCCQTQEGYSRSMTHQPMVKCVTRCVTSWDACLTSVQTIRISWCWWLLLTSPVSPRDITTSWLLWYLQIREREKGHVLDTAVLHIILWHISMTLRDVTSLKTVTLTCYISCIPLNSAATACVLVGPWLCCHVGNPKRCVMLVERIWAPVVQCVPVLGCCQPRWELALAGRWRCNTSTHFFGTSLSQRNGQSFRRKQQ
jgi:hypothetical protein